jgi:branched-chain amino acid transport system substrate-binding protein
MGPFMQLRLQKPVKAKSDGGQFFNMSFVGSKALTDEPGEPGAGATISQAVSFPCAPFSAIVRECQQRMTEGLRKAGNLGA